MKNRKSELDKFYTKPEVVEECISTVGIGRFKTIIDPCAGNGAFSSKIQNCIAFDVEPEDASVQRLDFFDYEPVLLQEPVLCITNVPFGVQSNLAVRFFNKAATFADEIAFILPKSFKKESIQKKLDGRFHQVYEKDIPKNSFILNNEEYDVPCVFQVWEKREYKRADKEKLYTNKFYFTSKATANVAIRRVGFYAGKAFKDVADKSPSSHYFIMYTNGSVDNFIEVMNTAIQWEHNNTVGPRSISKNELIEVIEGEVMV